MFIQEDEFSISKLRITEAQFNNGMEMLNTLDGGNSLIEAATIETGRDYINDSNSKPKTGLLTSAIIGLTLINPAAGAGAAYLIGKYGEDKLTQRSIDLGKDYIKNQSK